jgi:hypothetical protein
MPATTNAKQETGWISTIRHMKKMAGRDESLYQDPHSKKSTTFFPDPFFLKNTVV